jgi:hypothetical protein
MSFYKILLVFIKFFYQSNCKYNNLFLSYTLIPQRYYLQKAQVPDR